MVSKGNVLIVDDDIDILETAKMFLKQHFTHIDICQDPTNIPSIISRVSYDLILLDMNFRKGRNDGEEGFYWLARILEYDPSAVVILITAYGEIDLAIKAIKEGATDFVLKPWKNQKLLATAMAGWELHKSKKEVNKFKQANIRTQQQNFSTGLIGSSDAMKELNERIRQVADTDVNVLILGENGTGKELVAKALHMQSARKEQSFVKVDLGALPETLLETELFGHVKGAFTDAKDARIGSFELADTGTIFLDEIGNISLNAQAKLLSVLERREVRKVGANDPIEINVRVIAATNASISDLVDAGSFRQDLLFRLNTVEIQLAPLRDRGNDVIELFDHFLQEFNHKYKKQIRIKTGLYDAIKAYSWPGNVRELAHAVERAVILANDTIQVEDLIRKPIQKQTNPKTLDEMERSFLIRSLEDNGGNVSLTAKKIGLTRTAMYRRMKKYDI